MPRAAMSGMKREAAEPVKDRPAFVNLDRQRVVRPMADHDVGPGIYRGMAYLGHILQYLAAYSPMTGSDDDIRLSAQCGDVRREPLQILPVGPGQDLRRQAGPIGRRPPAMHRDLISGVPADHRDA